MAAVLPWGAGPPAPPADSPLQFFLRQVIYDGRYVDVVAKTPRAVADALGLDLSARDEAMLKESSVSERLEDMFIAVGPIIMIVGVVILAGIVVVVAWKYSHKARSGGILPVNDLSPHASLKL